MRHDPAERRELLLLAIAHAPDDDEPRLVYADWLLQRGDPRGDLSLPVAELTAAYPIRSTE